MAIVEQEQKYELVLTGRLGEPVGLTLWLWDDECLAAADANEIAKRKASVVAMESGEDGIGNEDMAQLMHDAQHERYVACIAGWDFTGDDKELFEGEGEPSFDAQTKRRLYDVPLFGKQIRAKVDSISDFTKPSKGG